MSDSRKGRRQRGCKLLGRELRIRRGHRSYAEMARMAKLPPLVGRVEPVSGSYLHKIEQGERIPSIDKLRTVGMLYGMSLEHMIRLIESEMLADIEPQASESDELLEEAREAIKIGDYRAAFAASLKAEEVAESPDEKIAAIGNKASCLWKLGLPEEAAKELLDLNGDSTLEVPTRVNLYYTLAAIQLSLWNLPTAELFAKEGLSLAKRVERSSETERLIGHLEAALGSARAKRAEEWEATGQVQPSSRAAREAVQHFEKAREIFRETQRPGPAALMLVNIGAAHCVEGNLLLGFQELRKGLGEARESNFQPAIAAGLLEMGKAFEKAERGDEARRHFVDAEAAASQCGSADLQFQALVHLIEGSMDRDDLLSPLVRRARALLPLLEEKSPERDKFEALLSQLGRAGGGVG